MTSNIGSGPRRFPGSTPRGWAESLEAKVAEIITRNLLTTDPGPAVRALRDAAGDQTDALARYAGTVAGFFMSPRTAVLCGAIIEEIDGAAQWAELGRLRRAGATSRSDVDG